MASRTDRKGRRTASGICPIYSSIDVIDATFAVPPRRTSRRSNAESQPGEKQSAMKQGGVARALIAGLCASLIGVGLARFSYSPLVPALIAQRWFSEAAVVYLSAANLAGYLVGAISGRTLAARSSDTFVLRAMQLVVAVAFIACAFPLSVPWFFVWRFLSGVAGGAIIVLVAATLLPSVPREREGAASGAIFLGVGAGIAASGTLVPALLAHAGLRETWIALGVLSLILTLANWTAWPAGKKPAQARSETQAVPTADSPKRTSILLDVVYALMAVGLVSPMLFLVDYVTRGLNLGAYDAAVIWIVYGIGSMCGPPAYGWLTDRLGASPAIRVTLTLQAAALLGLTFLHGTIVLGVLAFVIGSFPPGIVPLVLGWLREIYPNDAARQNAKWSRATVAFAAAQAAAAYAYSALFVASARDYRLLFGIACIAVVAAIALELIVPKLRAA
jgi:predicted MFS family arabinose efflux permease